jgi:hypothetical protein
VEIHKIRGVPVYVKREDLCWPFPPLSKARGVWAAIENRPGVNVAVVDTGRSLNGQLVATIGLTLGRKVMCGFPRYRKEPDVIPGPQLALRSLGVELVPLQANRQFMMRYEMGRLLPSGWFLFPTGLRLPETVDATEREAGAVSPSPGSFVVPTGTGTHLAGVLRAFSGPVLAIQGYAREEGRFRRDVERMAGRPIDQSRLRVVDPKRGYFEIRAGLLPPFPAHLHYETPAWAYLNGPGVVESLPQPIVFWNIGA